MLAQTTTMSKKEWGEVGPYSLLRGPLGVKNLPFDKILKFL